MTRMVNNTINAENTANATAILRSEWFNCGNRCQHDPLKPKFYQPAPKKLKNTPGIIKLMMHNVKLYFNDPDKWLTSLKGLDKLSKTKRTERREAIITVASIMFHHLELSSMRVGVPYDDGTFRNLTEKDIARIAGWYGIRRVQRAIADLKEAGFLTVKRRFKRNFEREKEYIGLPSVRIIHPKLFIELKVKYSMVKRERESATKRLIRKYRQYEKKLLPKQTRSINIKNIFKKMNKTGGGYHKPDHYQVKDYDANKLHLEKQKISLTAALKQQPEFKDISLSEFYEKFPKLKPMHKRE